MDDKKINLILCNDNPLINKIKYGDADLSSKRRKLDQIKEKEEEVEENDAYSNFERNVNKNCCQSSFADAISNTNEPVQYSIKSSAKDKLIITDRPSTSSKGFDNTFKLLQNQVKTHTQKTLDLLKIINPDIEFPSTSMSTIFAARDEQPTCLELQIEAMQRIYVYIKHFQEIKYAKICRNGKESTILLELLYKFVCSKISKDDLIDTEPTQPVEMTWKDNEYNLMYHAGKNTNGIKCLKIVQNLIKSNEGTYIF